MNLDIRLPIGGMFAIVGAVLLVFGLITAGRADLYPPRMVLGLNINIVWGLAMLVFGGFMLYLGRRSAGRAASGEAPPSGSRPRAH